MRKLAIVLIPLLIMALVLGAIGCGGEETKPTPTPTPTLTPTPTPTQTPTPTPTPVLTPTPTPPSGPVAPPPVCSFYGSLRVDGANAPVGTAVSAWIEDAKVAEATTTKVGSYVIKVVQPAGETYEGKTVAFRIDDRATGITSTWEAGEAKNVPLTVGE